MWGEITYSFPQFRWNFGMGAFTSHFTGHVHDDVIKWKHFPHYWPFVRRIHRSPVNSPHKGQWRGALMFSLICVWINGWVNNREAGDLRRHRAHYDVIVMITLVIWITHWHHIYRITATKQNMLQRGRGLTTREQRPSGGRPFDIDLSIRSMYSRCRSEGLCYLGWIMMTSSSRNIFRVTGPLCGEFTGLGEFPTQRPVTRNFWCFFLSASE